MKPIIIDWWCSAVPLQVGGQHCGIKRTVILFFALFWRLLKYMLQVYILCFLSISWHKIHSLHSSQMSIYILRASINSTNCCAAKEVRSMFLMQRNRIRVAFTLSESCQVIWCNLFWLVSIQPDCVNLQQVTTSRWGQIVKDDRDCNWTASSPLVTWTPKIATLNS